MKKQELVEPDKPSFAGTASGIEERKFEREVAVSAHQKQRNQVITDENELATLSVSMASPYFL